MGKRNKIRPAAAPAEPEAPLPQLEGGGFWRRVGAYLVDIMIVGICMLIVSKILLSLGLVAVHAIVFKVPLLIFMAYFVLLESSSWNATVGKRLLGMRVVDLQGNPVSLLRALLRYVAGVASWLPMGAGYAMVGVREDRRGLHDLLARTRVVRQVPSMIRLPLPAWIALWTVVSFYWFLMLLGSLATFIAQRPPSP